MLTIRVNLSFLLATLRKKEEGKINFNNVFYLPYINIILLFQRATWVKILNSILCILSTKPLKSSVYFALMAHPILGLSHMSNTQQPQSDRGY
jgi:hypothetical protein